MTSLMTLVAKTEQRESEIKDLQKQVKELTALVQQLAESGQRDREAAELTRQSEEQFWKRADQDIETQLIQFEAKLDAARSKNAWRLGAHAGNSRFRDRMRTAEMGSPWVLPL